MREDAKYSVECCVGAIKYFPGYCEYFLSETLTTSFAGGFNYPTVMVGIY